MNVKQENQLKTEIRQIEDTLDQLFYFGKLDFLTEAILRQHLRELGVKNYEIQG
jgi:hypothetical protein